MSFIKIIERINCLHKLISEQCIGTPEQLAKRLNISRATLYNLIEDMRSHDAPIAYSRKTETFYYTSSYSILLNYKIEAIENEKKLKKINGGSIELFSSVHFFRRIDDIFANISHFN